MRAHLYGTYALPGIDSAVLSTCHPTVVGTEFAETGQGLLGSAGLVAIPVAELFAVW